MCLAIPAEVIELRDPARALVDLGGVRREISVELLDAVAVGDFVIVHVGFALARLDPAEARRTLALIAEAGRLLGEGAAQGGALGSSSGTTSGATPDGTPDSITGSTPGIPPDHREP